MYVYVYIYLICIICIYVYLRVICMHQGSESNAISIICMFVWYIFTFMHLADAFIQSRMADDIWQNWQ